MFGKNPIRENETHLDGSALAVQEVFYTLQGEGPYSGMPAVFIRLAGCNLACAFCDTEFESGIDSRLGVDQIVAKVMQLPHHSFVVLTGGEPLRQNVIPLLERLIDAGVKLVQIETAGTLWVEGLEALVLDNVVELVCSPKTPGLHRMVIANCEHWKYVVEHDRVDPDDGLPIMGMQTRNIEMRQRIWRPWFDKGLTWWQSMGGDMGTIWVSPCDAHDGSITTEGPNRTKRNVAAATHIALKFGYRLSLQTHKIVDLP